MTHNLGSKNNIKAEFNQENPLAWFKNEIKDLEPQLLKKVYIEIFSGFDSFCNYAEKSVLLWDGCNRDKEKTGKQKYHQFSDSIKKSAKQQRIRLNSLPNGPAIVAYAFAGGVRPARYGSNNQWHIHHLYSGKFPYFGKDKTLHAVKDGKHFTQATGLVALHPLMDALADESPAFTWFLRYKAYEKFGYDPDQVFSNRIDSYGFAHNKKSKLVILQK